MKLTICIPTVVGREEQFTALYAKLDLQRKLANLSGDVDIIYEKDNKEISIGKKRDMLYNRAKGLYSVQIDDDDDVVDDYIETIYHELTGEDTIGYVERCIINGSVQYSKISGEFNDWESKYEEGYHYRRTPFFKVPILTELCKKVGVDDLRFGEDHDFARRLKPHIKTHKFINKVMYLYSANTLTAEQHKNRYGL